MRILQLWSGLSANFFCVFFMLVASQSLYPITLQFCMEGMMDFFAIYPVCAQYNLENNLLPFYASLIVSFIVSLILLILFVTTVTTVTSVKCVYIHM
jgi:hypothetical protein